MKNKLLFPARLLLSKFSRANYPFIVWLNVTSECNLRCSFCYASYYNRADCGLPLEKLSGIIGELKRAGTLYVNLAGGEPLLRPDIADIIACVKRNAMTCTVTTNGTLVEKRLKEIKEADALTFSIDGNREAHDACRGRGAFDSAMRGVEACASAGILFKFNSVLTRYSIPDIDFMVSLARKYKTQVGFSVLINNKSAEYGGFAPEDGQTRAALKHIIELKRRGYPVLFEAQAYLHSLAYPDYGVSAMMGGPSASRYCRGGRYFCTIDSDGKVYPCSVLIGKTDALNVLTDGLEKALAVARGNNCAMCSEPCPYAISRFLDLKLPAILDFVSDKLRHSLRQDMHT